MSWDSLVIGISVFFLYSYRRFTRNLLYTDHDISEISLAYNTVYNGTVILWSLAFFWSFLASMMSWPENIVLFILCFGGMAIPLTQALLNQLRNSLSRLTSEERRPE